eukprot:scaffold197352_cov28-Tisochrysis_lutea.AAC.4
MSLCLLDGLTSLQCDILMRATSSSALRGLAVVFRATNVAHSGSVPVSNTTWPIVSVKPRTSSVQPKQSASPSGAMSPTLSLPDAKARALGGVDTGRTKASDVVNVTGTMKK